MFYTFQEIGKVSLFTQFTTLEERPETLPLKAKFTPKDHTLE
jgi:hypothetical protein